MLYLGVCRFCRNFSLDLSPGCAPQLQIAPANTFAGCMAFSREIRRCGLDLPFLPQFRRWVRRHLSGFAVFAAVSVFHLSHRLRGGRASKAAVFAAISTFAQAPSPTSPPRSAAAPSGACHRFAWQVPPQAGEGLCRFCRDFGFLRCVALAWLWRAEGMARRSRHGKAWDMAPLARTGRWQATSGASIAGRMGGGKPTKGVGRDASRAHVLLTRTPTAASSRTPLPLEGCGMIYWPQESS